MPSRRNKSPTNPNHKGLPLLVFIFVTIDTHTHIQAVIIVLETAYAKLLLPTYVWKMLNACINIMTY